MYLVFRKRFTAMYNMKNINEKKPKVRIKKISLALIFTTKLIYFQREIIFNFFSNCYFQYHFFDTLILKVT